MRLHWNGLDGWENDREIGPRSLTIGRSSTCDIVIPHSRISRRHARIDTHDDGTVSIRDLGSRNGVFVNGSRTAESYLKPGDVIGIGPIAFHVVTQTGNVRQPVHDPATLGPVPARGAPPAVPRPGPPGVQPDAGAAESAYRQAIAAGQTSAHNHLGLLLQSQGDHAGAAAEYRQAIEAGHGAAAYNLSNLLSQQGDAGGSQRVLERARATPASAPSISLPMPPVAPIAQPAPDEALTATAPRKHRGWIWAFAAGGVVAGMVLLFAAAHALQPQALCKRNCPIPPPPKSAPLGYPTTYHSSKYGFSVAYDKALPPFRVTDSLIAWQLHNGQGSFDPSISGEPAHGRSPDHVVADAAASHFPQFSLQYRIPAAEAGYTPGSGAVYAGSWTPLQGQSMAARVAIVAAIRNNVAVVFSCEGVQVSESGALHPDPSALAGDVWCDQTLNTIQWKGQRAL